MVQSLKNLEFRKLLICMIIPDQTPRRHYFLWLLSIQSDFEAHSSDETGVLPSQPMDSLGLSILDWHVEKIYCNLHLTPIT